MGRHSVSHASVAVECSLTRGKNDDTDIIQEMIGAFGTKRHIRVFLRLMDDI